MRGTPCQEKSFARQRRLKVRKIPWNFPSAFPGVIFTRKLVRSHVLFSPSRAAVSHPSHRSQPGLVLTLGQGNVGQLGLGEDIMERKKPALVTLPEMVVQVEAGGMHTVCLSQTGKVRALSSGGVLEHGVGISHCSAHVLVPDLGVSMVSHGA